MMSGSLSNILFSELAFVNRNYHQGHCLGDTVSCNSLTKKATDKETGVTKTRNGKRNGMENGVKRKSKWKVSMENKIYEFL